MMKIISLVFAILLTGSSLRAKGQNLQPLTGSQYYGQHPNQINYQQQASFRTPQLSLPSLEKCPSGPPAQWRPHLDAASKAHLAPIVALGTLKSVQLSPIQMGGSSSASLAGGANLNQQGLIYHLQNMVNNLGLTIEASFTLTSLLKRPTNWWWASQQQQQQSTAGQHPNQNQQYLAPASRQQSAYRTPNKIPSEVKLYYHVSTSSLAITNALMQLVNQSSSGLNVNQASSMGQSATRANLYRSAQQQLHHPHLRQQQQNFFNANQLKSDQLSNGVLSCALKLTEQELNKKLGKLFKVNQNYILYLDQYSLASGSSGQFMMNNNMRYNSNNNNNYNYNNVNLSNRPPAGMSHQPARHRRASPYQPQVISAYNGNPNYHHHNNNQNFHHHHQQNHHQHHASNYHNHQANTFSSATAAASSTTGSLLNPGNTIINYSGNSVNVNSNQVGPSSQSASLEPQVAANLLWLYPFATHEPLSNQTSRSVSKILCKNCAQAPQIQLPNATVIASLAPSPQQTAPATNNQLESGLDQQQYQNDQPPPASRLIKLDCRVTGYPTPWIEWYKNGKLLRQNGNNNNKSTKTKFEIKNSKWKKRHNVRLSRLELELQAGRNETGIYECRAMNVAAREPVVGTYTLLVQPGQQIALIPLQMPQQQQTQNQVSVESELAGSSNSQQAASAPRPASTTQAPIVGNVSLHQLASDSQPSVASQMSISNSSSSTQLNPTNSQNSSSKSTSPPSSAPSAAISSTTSTISITPTQTTTTSSTPSPISTTTTTTTSTTGSPLLVSKQASNSSPTLDQQQQQRISINGNQHTGTHRVTTTTTKGPSISSSQTSNSQPCPREANDNYCLNGGTCLLIGHIEEYLCSCAEGYNGHRCEYKSLGHTKGASAHH